MDLAQRVTATGNRPDGRSRPPGWVPSLVGVTPRRPPGTSFESWVEKQIRESMDRGEFDGLAGSGRPISDLDAPPDELRWVRKKLEREGFTYLPPSLALRKEAEEARDRALAARTEAEARATLEAINVKLEAAVRTPLDGPSVYVAPFDVDRLVARWHKAHPEDPAVADPPPLPAEAAGRTRRPRGRWRRSPASPT